VIIVSALDNSGQSHAAGLVRALRDSGADETFVGIGGSDLARAGCRLVHDITDHSAMLAGAIGAARWALPAYRDLVREMDSGEVKLVILVDSPTFNLPLSRSAKKRGIKTFYYIAPQVWAWGRFRVAKIRNRVDRVAVILPFEESYFRQRGIDAHFVGHPFIHQIKQIAIDPECSRRITETPGPRIVILPGSRRGLVATLLPKQLSILRLIADRLRPVSTFILAWPALTDEIRRIVIAHKFDAAINQIPPAVDHISICTDHKSALIANAHLALAASGTGTLQVAWHGCPMIVMYAAPRLLYHLLARWLIRTKYLSLINILAGRELVPEFMPYITDKRKVADAAIQLLSDASRSQAIGRDLKNLLAPLDRAYDPGERAAQLALELIDES